MEHAQRAFLMRYAGEPVLRLNPYFNGTCSKSCSLYEGLILKMS